MKSELQTHVQVNKLYFFLISVLIQRNVDFPNCYDLLQSIGVLYLFGKIIGKLVKQDKNTIIRDNQSVNIIFKKRLHRLELKKTTFINTD